MRLLTRRSRRANAIASGDDMRARPVIRFTAKRHRSLYALERPAAVRALARHHAGLAACRHRAERHRRPPARLARHRQQAEPRQRRRDLHDAPPFFEAQEEREGQAAAAQPSLMSSKEQSHGFGDPLSERAAPPVGERPDRHARLVDALPRPRPRERLVRTERGVARRAAVDALLQISERLGFSGTSRHVREKRKPHASSGRSRGHGDGPCV